MASHVIELGWQKDGREYLVEWRYVLVGRSGNPECWVESVWDYETEEEVPDLIAEAERDAQSKTAVVEEMCEAEDSARDDAEQNRVDAYLDERRGL